MKDEYENYRGITVLNIFSRLYEKIIKYFLEQKFSQVETEEQVGLRAGLMEEDWNDRDNWRKKIL